MLPDPEHVAGFFTGIELPSSCSPWRNFVRRRERSLCPDQHGECLFRCRRYPRRNTGITAVTSCACLLPIEIASLFPFLPFYLSPFTEPHPFLPRRAIGCPPPFREEMKFPGFLATAGFAFFLLADCKCSAVYFQVPFFTGSEGSGPRTS